MTTKVTDKYCGIDPATLDPEVLAVLDEAPWEPGHCSLRRDGVCARDYEVQEGGEQQDDLWDYVGVQRSYQWKDKGGTPEALRAAQARSVAARGRHGLGFLDRPQGRGSYKHPRSPASRRKILAAYKAQVTEEG